MSGQDVEFDCILFLNIAFSFSCSRRNKHLVSIFTRQKAWVSSFIHIEILLDCKRVENKNNR